MELLQESTKLTQELSITPTRAKTCGLTVNQDGAARSAFSLLSYPEISWDDLERIWPELSGIPKEIALQVENDARYQVYLSRQQADIRALKGSEAGHIPADIEFARIGGLSSEIRSKLELVRPTTVGQASRIEGMTPVALAALLAHIRVRQSRVGI